MQIRFFITNFVEWENMTMTKPVEQALPQTDLEASNSNYAEEVKSERLKVLNNVMIVVSAIIVLILLTFGTLAKLGGDQILAYASAVIILAAGGLFSNFLLGKQPFPYAAWTFVLTPMLSMSVLMYQIQPAEGEQISLAVQVVPFVFPLIVFIGGLLVSPISTIYMTLFSIAIIIGVPAINRSFSPTVHQWFAVLLTGLAAGLASQVTGELYAITQWALSNYSRERRTNEELFEKRLEVQRSLKRAEALGEQLKETNHDLEKAKAEAEEAKHFRGQFLANMSHELRTPLNAIIGFSETMLQFPIMYDDQALPDAYERDLNQIYNSGRQLLHVINDILDLAKVDAGKLEIHMQEVEAGAIVNAVMSTARGLLGSKNVKLDKEAMDPIPNVWGDESRLRQVLLNLYSNACKYTDEGSILLKVTELPATGEIQFAIQDTGVGIAASEHEKLFQEFQQAKSGGRDPRSGSGLGLAISRQLLELMGGRIWMESTVGKGSTFYFTVKKHTAQEKQSNGANGNGVKEVAALSPKAEGVE
jgi:signal transduction histidine kinase